MIIRQTSYLRKSLMAGEQALLEAHLHWVNYTQAYLLLALSVVMLILGIVILPCLVGVPVFLIWGLAAWLKSNSTQMLVTNKRVIFKDGIVGIHTEEIRNAKVESIEITQSVSGRLLGYATIHFSGTGNSDVFFPAVADPWSVKNMAEQIVSGEPSVSR